jgi:FMN-dependent NADH-azoreductase
LAHAILDQLLLDHPAARVITRLIGGNTIPHVDAHYAASQQASSDVAAEGSTALSDALIKELEQADMLVISTPMHNFSLPSALKAWIDHIARVRRTFNIGPNGKSGLLTDRPVFIAIAAGGHFSGERARQPDFLRPYLRSVLNMIGLHDLHFFTAEGTAMGPEALNDARNGAERALQLHFSTSTPA